MSWSPELEGKVNGLRRQLVLEGQTLVGTPHSKLAQGIPHLDGQLGEQLAHHQGLGQGGLVDVNIEFSVNILVITVNIDFSVTILLIHVDIDFSLAEARVTSLTEQHLDPFGNVATGFLKISYLMY